MAVLSVTGRGRTCVDIDASADSPSVLMPSVL